MLDSVTLHTDVLSVSSYYSRKRIAKSKYQPQGMSGPNGAFSMTSGLEIFDNQHDFSLQIQSREK